MKTVTTRAKLASQLQVIDRCLILMMPEDLQGDVLDKFLEDVTDYIYGSSYKGLVVDLSALDVIDAGIVSSLECFIDVLRVLGYPCAVSGILPQCAAVMTEMRFPLRADINTEWLTEDAMKKLVTPAHRSFGS